MSGAIFKNESPEAQRAQKLLEEKFREEFAQVPDGWDFGIDLDTLKTYKARSPLEIDEEAKNPAKKVTVAHKVKGRDEWPWRIHVLDPRTIRLLEEFVAGNCCAFAFSAQGHNEFRPTLFRKIDEHTSAVIVAESVEKLKDFQPQPWNGEEIRRITIEDVRESLKGRRGSWVVQLI